MVKEHVVDDELRDEIISTIQDDWLDVGMISFLVKEVSGDDSDLLARTLDVIEELVQLDVITPGVIGVEGFEPWTGTRSELVERIRRESQQFPTIESLLIGGICWFDLTEDLPKPAP